MSENNAEKIADSERFIITKGEVNTNLWNDILKKSKGTNHEKISACQLIFQNYESLPIEADEILKEFVSPVQPEDVRRAVGLELTKERVHIPAGLYFELLEILAKDPCPEIRKIVESKYAQLTDLTRIIMQATQNFVKVTDFAKELGKIVQETIEPITRMLKEFLEISQKIYEISKVFEEPEFKAFEYNWLIFLPIPSMLKLYKMHKNGKDEEIKQLLIQVCRAEEFLLNLNEEMKNSNISPMRIAIIKDAIDAHISKKYTLSIPVLLAQIEGILWDYAEKMGIEYGADIITRNGKEKEIRSVKLLLKESKLAELMFEHLVNYYLNSIYTKEFRHGILHGRILDYGIEEKSATLILLLRAILNNLK